MMETTEGHDLSSSSDGGLFQLRASLCTEAKRRLIVAPNGSGMEKLQRLLQHLLVLEPLSLLCFLVTSAVGFLCFAFS